MTVCTHSILQKKYKKNNANQLFIGLKKPCNLVRREVFYNRATQSSTLVRLINLCLNETCGNIQTVTHLSKTFLIQNDLKVGDTLITTAIHLFLSICHYKGLTKPEGMKLNGIYQLPVYTDDINLLDKQEPYKNTATLLSTVISQS